MNYLLFLFGLLLVISGCSKIMEDDELSLKKTPYTGNQLRIDGYYYSRDSSSIYDSYIFYRNGVLLDGGGELSGSFSELENIFKSDLFDSFNRESKTVWGLFVINESQISFETWYPSSGGGMPAYIMSGTIINDTTFKITRSMRSNGSEKETKDITYHFKKFSPKPDSSNVFL